MVQNLSACGYGFRAHAFGVPRDDSGYGGAPETLPSGRALRTEVRLAAIGERALAPRHLRFIRWLQLERCGAVAHRVGVDAGDRGDVDRGRGTDRNVAHAVNLSSARPREGGDPEPRAGFPL